MKTYMVWAAGLGACALLLFLLWPRQATTAAEREALQEGPWLYPGYVLTAEAAAQWAAMLLLLLLALGPTPGRVRLSFSRGRYTFFRRVRRGHVLVLVVVFGVSLTPLTCVRPARGGGGGGGTSPPPPPPVYFIHSDHLGSTTLLTCYKRPSGESCPDHTPAAYFRYDPYGVMRAYTKTGTTVSAGSELTNLLYTGQRWDWPVRLYDYGARVYDPRIANFLTEDPVREYMNPYAYVRWNPVKFTDPTGLFSLGTLELEGRMAAAACGGGCENLAAAVRLAGGFYAGGTGGFAGGLTGSGPEGRGFGAFGAMFGLSVGGAMGSGGAGTATAVNADVAGAIMGRIDAALGGAGGPTFMTAVSQTLQQGMTAEINFHFGGVGPATLSPFFGGVLASGIPTGALAGLAGPGTATTGVAPGMSLGQGAALLATALAIGGTGAVRAQAALAEIGDAGGTAVRVGGIGGAATGLAILGDASGGLVVGGSFVFTAGMLTGVVINDALLAPMTGGVTYHELGVY